MLINRISLFVLASTLLAQTPAPKGSISGTVQEVGGGVPIPGAKVYVSPGAKSAETDEKGHFEVKDLAAGSYRIRAVAEGIQGPHATKMMQLAPGQDLTVDFRLNPSSNISGRVTDENGEPVPGAGVRLIAREYRLGQLRYVYAKSSETDDQGKYKFANVEPGPGYLIEAVKEDHKLSAISDAPADPKLRKKAVVPTWYPDSNSMDAGQIVVLQPGEHREGTDIRLRKSLSYCIDGVLAGDRGPAPLRFSIEQLSPSSGESGDGGSYLAPAGGEAGADGQIRICGLSSGVYRMTAYQESNNGHTFYGEEEVPVGDKDVHGIKVYGRQQISVSGELVWDSKAPDQPVSGQVRLMLMPMTRAFFMSELASTANLPPLTVPGQFNLPGLLADDYSVKVLRVPDGSYLKDIVYGGQSALYEPMHVGKTMGSSLRIVLAHDGGVVRVNVTDKDNKPVTDCKVVLLPDSATTEAAVADAMLQGQTDQFGAYTSGSIAPGKYFVLATDGSFDRTPEGIMRLMRARTQAQQVELTPNGTANLTLSPLALQ